MITWRTKRIGEIGQVFDGPHATPKTIDEGPVFLGIPSLASGRLDLSATRHVSEEDFQKWTKRVEPRSGDIVFSYETKIGEAALIPEGLRCCLGRRMGLVRLDPAKCDSRYFLYQYLSPDYQQFIASRTVHGATVDRLLLKDFPNFEFPLPPISEQREIAAVLGALDDKIEVNRKTAATLEAMTRALYRSWFVDFDPVHARNQGKAPAHMGQATAALFPDRFGDDGLPEGWEWETFENYYTVLETGKRPKGGIREVEDGVPSIGAESIKQIGFFDFGKTKFIPRAYFEAMRKGHLADGDILIYKDGGKPGELRPAATYISKAFPFDEACINEHVFRVRVAEELGQHFGFLALSSDHCMYQMRELATGVAQPGLNQSAMKALSFLKPSEPKIIDALNALVGPLLDGCNEKAKENQTLASLRDTLLPKLMSGELRVGAVREQVEEVI